VSAVALVVESEAQTAAPVADNGGAVTDASQAGDNGAPESE
jgi:hypothetical protein